MSKKFDIAKNFYPEAIMPLVSNLMIQPTFLENGDFYYKEEFFDGEVKKFKYVLVKNGTGEKTELFKHASLAEELNRIDEKQCKDSEKSENTEKSAACSEKAIDPYLLPIIIKNISGDTLIFSNDGKDYKLHAEKITIIGDSLSTNYVVSPNGKKAAFVKKHDLYVLDIETNKVSRLTNDGSKHNAYASPFEGDTMLLANRAMNFVPPCNVKWSPDSKYLITQKINEKKCRDMHLLKNVVNEGDMAPVHIKYKFAFPADKEIQLSELYVIDVNARHVNKCDIPPFHPGIINVIKDSSGGAIWSFEGKKVIAFSISRDRKTANFYEIERKTGKSRLIFTEETDTFLFFDFEHMSGTSTPYVDPNSKNLVHFFEKENVLLFVSIRDGHRHIYNYDVENAVLRNQVTKGDFEVAHIVNYDVEKKTIYFMAAAVDKNEDPYHDKLYSIKIDGSEMKCLSPESGTHYANLSFDNKYFTDVFSDVNTPNKLVYKKISGETICELVTGDISRYEAVGYSKPIPFKLKGADGETDVYGIMVLPPDFDENKKYPVVEYHYGGTQTSIVPHEFAQATINTMAQPVSKMGFISITIDGRGTPGRGKKFHDFAHKNLKCCAGLVDHVAVYNQLCEKYKFIDKDRIGIFGHSGGGYGSVHALIDFPETYKCAVASGGNHVNEIYISGWSELFMNLYEKDLWAEQSVEKIVSKLEGKLYLIHGELDDNVHPAQTMRLADALIKADKDFDFLIMPNMHHALTGDYIRRRTLEYFENNL